MRFFDIHPVNLVKALSMALELSINGMSRHHWQTAMICKKIADQILMSTTEQRTLVFAALLHDIGAASSWDERQKIKQTDMFEKRSLGAHAEAGYLLLKDSPQLGYIAESIRYHHDYWCGGNKSGLQGEQIPIVSRIIHLADRVQILIHHNQSIFAQREKILDSIDRSSGIVFDPFLVEAVHEITKAESFWLDLVNASYYENFFKTLDVYGSVRYSSDDAIQIANIFAKIIDRISKFTAHHSRSVTKTAVFLAKLEGFSEDDAKSMEIAGLLHDLGKLAVPNAILEKPGKLTADEVVIVRQHTYYTYRILEQIDHFEIIAQWAAYHHETLDGQGYPFRIGGKDLSLGSRILAVADIFVALTESRPYRESLPKQKVQDIMTNMVKQNKIDGNVLKTLFDHYDDAILLVDIRLAVKESEKFA